MTEKRAAEIKSKAENALVKVMLMVNMTLEQEKNSLVDEEEMELFIKYFMAGYGGFMTSVENEDPEVDDAGELLHNLVDASKSFYEEVYQIDQSEEES